jgi:uncharacterized protein
LKNTETAKAHRLGLLEISIQIAINLILVFTLHNLDFISWEFTSLIIATLGIAALFIMKPARTFLIDSLKNFEVLKKASVYLHVLLGFLLLFFFQAYLYHTDISLTTTMNLLTSKASIHPGQTLSQISLFILGTAILIPIYEELFFRNLLQGYLQTKLPVVWSILIVSVYFGSFHFGYVYVATASGIIAGILYTLHKSPYPPIMFHILWSLFSMFYYNYI